MSYANLHTHMKMWPFGHSLGLRFPSTITGGRFGVTRLKKKRDQAEHLKISVCEMQAIDAEPPAEIPRSCSWLLKLKVTNPHRLETKA